MLGAHHRAQQSPFRSTSACNSQQLPQCAPAAASVVRQRLPHKRTSTSALINSYTQTLNMCMRIREIIKPKKPLTPDQARVQALQRGVDTAKQAVKRERANQQLKKSQLALANASKAT